jgi:hypothetical protein
MLIKGSVHSMVSSFGCPDKPFQLPLNGVNTARQLILWFLEFLWGYNFKKRRGRVTGTFLDHQSSGSNKSHA